MDIRDTRFEKEQFVNKDRFGWMLQRQRALMALYGRVEDKKELVDPRLVDLHSKRDQTLIKDFAYRVIEETIEIFEAWEEDDLDHLKEELADATHFMLELMILANAVPEYSGPDGLMYTHSRTTSFASDNSMHGTCFDFIYALASAVQKLKNRSWRAQETPINVKQFRDGLAAAWVRLYMVGLRANLTHDDFFEAYYRKSEVNLFRLRSNY